VWVAPSGERLEGRTQTAPYGWEQNDTRAWSRLLLSESQPRALTGDCAIEFLVQRRASVKIVVRRYAVEMQHSTAVAFANEVGVPHEGHAG
jgi:hypothetical protein